MEATINSRRLTYALEEPGEVPCGGTIPSIDWKKTDSITCLQTKLGSFFYSNGHQPALEILKVTCQCLLEPMAEGIPATVEVGTPDALTAG